MAPLNSPQEKLSEHKIKTLTNAARISCLVKGPTIGPNAIDPRLSPPPLAQCPQAAAPAPVIPSNPSPVKPVAAKPERPRWTYDSWRPVKTDADDDADNDDADAPPRCHYTHSTPTLADCRAIRFQIAQRQLLQTQRRIVREKQAERATAYEQMMRQLQDFRITAKEQALSALRAATLAKEERIVAAAAAFDEEARAEQQRHQQEMDETVRRTQERRERLRRDEEVRAHFEAIKSGKGLFIVAYEKLVEAIVQHRQVLVGAEEYDRGKAEFLQRYEQLLTAVNRGQIGGEQVQQMETLCEEVQRMQRSVEAEVSESGERLAQMMQAQEAQRKAAEAAKAAEAEERERVEQEKRLQEQQLLQQQQQQQQLSVQPTIAAADALDAGSQLNAAAAAAGGQPPQQPQQFVHPERFAHYTAVLDFYEQYKLSVKPLQADDSLKKYRFNCQKAVNIPLNAISAVSPQHLADKCDKLGALLGGAAVQVGDCSVSAAEHPLGVRFCSLLAAKKLVNQADSIISTDPKHAFPIAAIIVAVWQRFPDMGRLCLAYLYKESPYLAPYFVPRRDGQSAEDWLQALGYRCADGQVEGAELYLKRQTGLVRLYAAIVVSQPRRSQQMVAHPHGPANGWLWLANFMNLDPLPDICATLLHEFLAVAGADLWRTYGAQFHKLLVALYQQYLVRLAKVDKGGPRARLEALLARMLQERRVEEPEGKLPPHFW